MGWFSIASIVLFVALIIRAVLKIIQKGPGKFRQYLLVAVFCMHIAVIIYLSLD